MDETCDALTLGERREVSRLGRRHRAHKNTATAMVLVFSSAVMIGVSWLVAVGAVELFAASTFGVMLPVTSALMVYVALIAWLFVRRRGVTT